MTKKSYEEYRQEIYYLDEKIGRTEDKEEKLKLIDENIQLNNEYINKLKKPIPVKIVLCVVLSIFWLIGLMIFLPQIIIRKTKIKACKRRLYALEQLKGELQ